MSLFTSAEERRRREKEYQNKIFPLGMGQRDLALAALRPNIRVKISDAEVLYAFVVAKQHYLDADGDISAAETYLNKTGIFIEPEKRIIMKLIKLDAAVTDLDDYPDVVI